MQLNNLPLKGVIRNVQQMTSWNSEAQKLAKNYGLSIQSVTWEDCARNKGSVWGPCISDMTLQINDDRMPVMREPNYSDKTWDVKMEKIPIVVGNEKEIPGNKLKTVSLKEYLNNFEKYMTNESKYKKINLLRNGNNKSKDDYVIMSSQCCFLPIEKGKETKFNVALYNYQSRKNNPAVLVIVATSKGSSAQIIQGNQQKLLFNNYGKKADFIGQRLTDNRIERGVSIHGAMTKKEKQDNCIIIIQVPLKQQPIYRNNYNNFKSNKIWGYSFNNNVNNNNNNNFYGGMPPTNAFNQSMSNVKHKKRCSADLLRSKKKQNANVESAIIKVAPKTHPVCKCGDMLYKYQVQYTYNNNNNQQPSIQCDKCNKTVNNPTDIIYHCKKKGNHYLHKHGYDLCLECGENQLKFDELDGLTFDKLVRDERYPIRVTLQYYKSTDNGIVNNNIMKAIKELLTKSQSNADFIGSLVTDYSNRPTEFIKEQKDNYNNYNDKDGQQRTKIKQACIEIFGNQWLQYYNKFVEQEILDSDLPNLNDNDWGAIISKIGPRSRFRKWVKDRLPNNNFLNGFF